MKKLTIGVATYNDYEGTYFTFQSIRLNNQDILDDLDLVVIDNNPESVKGRATKDFCAKAKIRYIKYGERRSTASRNEVFMQAEAPYTMCMDSHVLLEPDTIKKLIAWYEEHPDTNDLIHGPMLYDWLDEEIMSMKPVWRDNMFGIWDDSDKPDGDEAIEIPMHGLGLFSCRTEAWLGFHPLFRGFGGEEGYIHEKFRKAGHKILCLPFLRWLHKFRHADEQEFPLIIEERILNYLIGHMDNELDVHDVIEHFEKTQPHIPMDNLLQNAKFLMEQHKEDPKKD